MRKRNGIIYGVVGFIVFFLWLEGGGADWKMITKDAQGNVFEIDATTLSRQPDTTVKVLVKTTYSKKGRNEIVKNYGKVFKVLSHCTKLNEYHCTEKKNRTLETHWYSLDGEKMYSVKSTPEWELMIPDSMGEIMFKAVCK